MAQLIFPPNPTNNQEYTGGNGITYVYKSPPGVWTAPPTGEAPEYGTFLLAYNAPWTSTTKGNVAASPTAICMMAMRKIWRSTDGFNWTSVHDLPADFTPSTFSFAYGGNGSFMLYNSTAGYGRVSSDNGLTWSPLTFPIPNSYDTSNFKLAGAPAEDGVSRFMLIPTQGQTANIPAKCGYSENLGSSWSSSNSPIIGGQGFLGEGGALGGVLTSIGPSFGLCYESLVGQSYSRLYTSNNGGVTWTQRTNTNGGGGQVGALGGNGFAIGWRDGSTGVNIGYIYGFNGTTSFQYQLPAAFTGPSGTFTAGILAGTIHENQLVGSGHVGAFYFGTPSSSVVPYVQGLQSNMTTAANDVVFFKGHYFFFTTGNNVFYNVKFR